MPLDRFTVAAAQIDPRLGDVEANLTLYEDTIREAKGRGADLVLFPELSLTGYLLRDMVTTVALRLESAELRRLRELSYDVAVVVGFVEETPAFRFHNSAALLDQGEIVALHRKVYLPTYGMFDEQRYFARGREIRAFDSRFGRGAILVCEDLWHPSTAYLAALDEALFILCPSSSPLRGVSEGREIDDNAAFWEKITHFYASVFDVSLAYANRVGFEDGIGFWGGSEILDARGARVAKGKYYETDLVVGEIVAGVARRQRIVSPLLRDEDVDLTINELLRIRGRPREGEIEHREEEAPAGQERGEPEAPAEPRPARSPRARRVRGSAK